PVGFHQFTDPGVPAAWKLVHSLMTMMVGVPSLLTAFTVAASLELGGRRRGGKGWFGWIPKLPWRDEIGRAACSDRVWIGGDAIRDFHVTGVQTCALPISRRVPPVHRPGRPRGVEAGPLADDDDGRRAQPAHGVHRGRVAGARRAAPGRQGLVRLDPEAAVAR